MRSISELASVDFLSQLEIRQQLQAHQRQEQEYDFVPTTITSVSFFEADTTSSFNIINQEVTYVDIEGGALTDGYVLNYTSISSKLDPNLPINDQTELVPGGVMLVLFGINSNGVMVQNTIAWGYKANCEGEILLSGGSGWIAIEEVRPPPPKFCNEDTIQSR